LRCTSCHLDRGQRPNAAPLVGVAARYPKLMERAGVVASLEDRVNYCFTRSLAGDALPTQSGDMRDIVAYLGFISRHSASGGHVAGEGMARMAALTGDSARGAAVFLASCTRCHGEGGQGSSVVPALWGAKSYSIGASMARVERAASFVRHNMPYDRPGTLTDQQALDVAAYIDSQARPDSPGKEHDWPAGGAPADVPYDTRGHRASNPPPVLPRTQRSSSSISRDAVTGSPAALSASVRR
jgi:thiosulfate dehydrogenase